MTACSIGPAATSLFRDIASALEAYAAKTVHRMAQFDLRWARFLHSLIV